MPLRPPFQPTAVVAVDVTIDRSLDDVTVPARYAQALVLARVNGVPVGYVRADVVAGRIDGRALWRSLLDEHEERIVRRLVADTIAARSETVSRTAAADALVTVAVCTRDHAADLARCLESLRALRYPRLEILVVDNAPRTDETERLVASIGGIVRYVREDRPGLSWARRRGIEEARGDVIAFTDDDVIVDPEWVSAIVERFEDDDVMMVLGLVGPAELETPAQLDFEWHGGFGRGFARRWIRRRRDRPAAPALANTGTFGIGANMAFRRVVFAEVGPFDVTLGAGTPSLGGEDLEITFRIIEAGHTVAYEPAALVWHRHRREAAALRAQCVSWGLGMMAYLARAWRAYPAERRGLLRLAAGTLLAYHPRRVMQSVVDRRLQIRLTTAEWWGMAVGTWRWLTMASTDAASVRAVAAAAPVPAAAATTVDVDLDRPWPKAFNPTEGSDTVEIVVYRGPTVLDRVAIMCGSASVSRIRAVDAVTAALTIDALDPSGYVHSRVRAWEP